MTGYGGYKKVLAGAIRFLWRVKVVQPENQPKEGGFLLCCNHLSLVDVVLLAVCTDQPINYMAKQEAMKIPVVGAFLKSLGAFPVRRGTADLAALKKAMGIIREGGVVGYFPQGTRCPDVDPRTTSVKSGAGMMVFHTKCNVLPVFLRTEDHQKVKLFHRTEVVYGKPILFEDLPFEKGTTSEMQGVTEYIFQRICDLEGEQA